MKDNLHLLTMRKRPHRKIIAHYDLKVMRVIFMIYVIFNLNFLQRWSIFYNFILGAVFTILLIIRLHVYHDPFLYLPNCSLPSTISVSPHYYLSLLLPCSYSFLSIFSSCCFWVFDISLHLYIYMREIIYLYLSIDLYLYMRDHSVPDSLLPNFTQPDTLQTPSTYLFSSNSSKVRNVFQILRIHI